MTQKTTQAPGGRVDTEVLLLDIEGTISPIAFVRETLFPISAERLPSYVDEHAMEPSVMHALAAVVATVRAEVGREIDRSGAVDQLLAWIKEDRKHPALKALQARVWAERFAAGALITPIYDDVPVALRAFRDCGGRAAIYSSGAESAQRLYLGHSNHGDLLPLVEAFFDLAIGSKLDPGSYTKIAARLEADVSRVLFLSDHPGEVAAAREAGMSSLMVVRPGNPHQAGDSRHILSLAELHLCRSSPGAAPLGEGHPTQTPPISN